jgi:hypothetical protein
MLIYYLERKPLSINQDWGHPYRTCRKLSSLSYCQHSYESQQMNLYLDMPAAEKRWSGLGDVCERAMH